MKTSLCRQALSLFLLLPLLAAGLALAQDPATPTPEPKTPLPLPLSPEITLTSDIDDNDVEQGVFTITSPNTTQFDNAESVDWLAVNAETRGEAEGSLDPSAAGTITINAADLEYADGHIISFSMLQVAALDDEDYTNSSRLIFCYPVYEDCQDPETLVRSLPPPLDATVALVPPVSEGESQGELPAAQTEEEGDTFEVTIPLRGTVINNAGGFDWTANNMNRDVTGSGTETRQDGESQITAQVVDPTVTVRFGADLIGYEMEDIVRIVLVSKAEEDSRRYVDSHPVTYWFCEVPDDPDPDCEALWNSRNDNNNGNGGSGIVGSGNIGGSGADSRGICLNTDEAAPIVVCSDDDYVTYTLYGINADSTSVELQNIQSSSSLFESDADANDSLASGTNTAANKAYTISYDGDGVMTLSTYYADKGPDVDKPYIITIDTHNTVRYTQW